MKPLRVGYFCIIPTLWLKKPVITGYFASMIDYYHNASTYSKVFLKGLGYPVKYAQSSNYISTQKAFKEIDCVEKFDISYYL